MALNASAFGIGETPEEQQQAQQPTTKRRPTPPGGLMALVRATQSDDDLSQEPLGEGELSSPIATPGLSGKPGEPSLLATERVERAPQTYSASPLLGEDERFGSAVSEAERGEEGTYGGGTKQGLSTAARNKALMQFFRPSQAESPDTDTAEAIGLTKRAASSALTGAKAVRDIDRAMDQRSTSRGGASNSAESNFAQLPTTPGSDIMPFDMPAGDGGVHPGVDFGGLRNLYMPPADPNGMGEWEGFGKMWQPDATTPYGGADPLNGPLKNPSSMPGGSLPGAGNPTLGAGASGAAAVSQLGGFVARMLKDKDLATASGGVGIAGQGMRLANDLIKQGMNAGLTNPANYANAAGLVGAGLSLAGQLTGDEDLAKVGQWIGAGASVGAAGAALAASGTSATLAAGGAAGLGAASGIAGGVLAIPALVQMGLEEWAPDWVHESHYGKTRSKEDRKAQGQLALMDFLSERAQEDPRMTGAVLGYKSGPIQARYNDRPISEMDMSERVAMLDAIKADPKLLDLITADAGAIPYLDERNRSYFANEAQDYTRNLVAKQLGLDYAFIPTQHRVRDYHGYSSGAPNTSGDDRLSNIWGYDNEGTPTGALNPNANWQDVIDALQTRQARGTNMQGLPSIEEAQRMLAQQGGLRALINDPGYEEQQARAQYLASMGS